MFVRQFFQSVLGLFFLVSSSLTLSNAEFTYNFVANGIEVTGCIDNCPNNLRIPEAIDGFSVTKIADSAFYNVWTPNVWIPKSVISIGKESFWSSGVDNIFFLGDRPLFSGNPFYFNALEGVYFCVNASGWPGEPVKGTEDMQPMQDDSCIYENPIDEPNSTYYSVFDVDNNGSFDALTDGLIILRYAFGLRGNSLVDGAIASDATRTSASEIETHIQSLLP